MSTETEMRNDAAVLVRLCGEEPGIWHKGVVLKARKQWVEIDAADELAPFIAAENCICEWRNA